MLGSDAAHGASDIPVHLGVSDFVEAVGEVDELERLFAKDLWDDRDRVAIVLRYHVIDFLPGICQIAVGEREKWRNGEVECFRETMVVYFAEHQFGKPLHGS